MAGFSRVIDATPGALTTLIAASGVIGFNEMASALPEAAASDPIAVVRVAVLASWELSVR